jgi:hypothetical protein
MYNDVMVDRSTRARWAAFVLALAGAGLGILVLYHESMRGFPDGHLTDYDRAVRGPAKLLAYSSLVIATELGILAIRPRGSRQQAVLAASAGGLLLILAALVALTVFFRGLDSGQGG